MELETNNIIVGAGLISLDVLIWDGQRVPISYYVGGTCGNVMMILSHMGWDAYPIARLDSTKDGVRVLDDMKKHRVHTDFVSTQDGKTPVIVQRNFINKDGVPTHKFESRNNIGRFYLDFKSLTLKQANEVIERIDFVPKVFFFDRVSPAILKLATTFKEKGSVIFFEPSSRGGNDAFFYCSHVISVTSLIQNPFEIVWGVFSGLPTSATLYVPKGTKAKYEATYAWNQFKNIVEIDDELNAVDAVSLGAEATEMNRYTIGGQRVSDFPTKSGNFL